ncbi:MAG: glycosyltransferase [Deltaproteobacteria bacterium]|nr:MAG: glycosyltransferase [Deltaproteobacteria bacterium]
MAEASGWELFVVGAYFALLGVLSVFGLHRASLLWRLRRQRPEAAQGALPAELPVVTVQLPIYNERHVATRLLDAVCRLRYPRSRLEIQVLDDSTDDTTLRLADAVARWRAAGIDVVHLRRGARQGYKAGALAHGLARARGELIAIFDADFVPPPDFLLRLLPHFADPTVGMVQARWGHLNRENSWLTRAQALLLDGHFAIEHAARYRSGAFFNFNGTAGIWRRGAIEAAGGWACDTLTEDLDLSYRAQLCGWRFVYVDAVRTPAELPSEIHAFKSQQRRWAKGSVQTARKLLGRILRARLPRHVTREAIFHLCANLVWPLMVLLAILMPPAAAYRSGHGMRQALLVDLPVFFCATVSVAVFYVSSQRGSGRSPARLWLEVPLAMAVGAGLSLSNARAVLEGLLGISSPFVRTPKSGETDGQRRRTRHDLKASLLGSAVEVCLAAYLLGASLWLAGRGAWVSVPFVLLFAFGYLVVGLSSLWSGWELRRSRPAASLASNRCC